MKLRERALKGDWEGAVVALEVVFGGGREGGRGEGMDRESFLKIKYVILRQKFFEFLEVFFFFFFFWFYFVSFCFILFYFILFFICLFFVCCCFIEISYSIPLKIHFVHYYFTNTTERPKNGGNFMSAE